MPYASVDVCNAALLRLGASPITNFTEGSATADACARLYPLTRDALLTLQPWPWATLRQSLSRLALTPPSDWLYYYALPTDPACLRVLDLALADYATEYHRELALERQADGTTRTYDVIATDATSVVVRYIGAVSEAHFPALFAEVLSLRLAVTLCGTVTGKASLQKELAVELAGLLTKLAQVAGGEDSPAAVAFPTAYLSARGDPSHAAPTRYEW